MKPSWCRSAVAKGRGVRTQILHHVIQTKRRRGAAICGVVDLMTLLPLSLNTSLL